MAGRHVRSAVAVTLAFVVWGATAATSAAYLFLHDHRDVVLASHNAEIRPTWERQAVLRTGPVLPDLRLPIDDRLGVEIRLGKTEAHSTEQLLARYAVIASQPDGQVEKVHAAVRDMVRDALVRGALIGLVPLLVWWLVGRVRRRELATRLRSPAVLAVLVTLVVGVVAWWRPWAQQDEPVVPDEEWMPLADYLGVEPPDGLDAVEVRGGAIAGQTRRLIDSALSTYDLSKEFYGKAAASAADIEVRQPAADETVVLFVSDRHDNVGMDRVARAVGERAGASAVMNGGDDTSTGKSWEAFSLDSVSRAYDDWPRWSVIGNHDHGDFVGDYLGDRGWTRLDGEVVDGPGDSTLLGVDDPRSSGLGNWRDETGLSFDGVAQRLADAACAEDEPVGTILVHDTDLGRPALERGCVDLVIGGHTHVAKGPVPFEGENGHVGYEFTTGTAGGAAYAIAMGSKPRRPAVVSLLTYRDGRPVGVQVVTLQTDGSWNVDDYRPLTR